MKAKRPVIRGSAKRYRMSNVAENKISCLRNVLLSYAVIFQLHFVLCALENYQIKRDIKLFCDIPLDDQSAVIGENFLKRFTKLSN